MFTIDDMKKELKENPKRKEILERQLEYYFPKWIWSKNKIEILNHLPNSYINFLFQCNLLISVTESGIEQSSESEDFQEIKKLFINIIDGQNELLDEVNQIYVKNVENVKTEYKKKISDFKYSVLPKDKRAQIDKLKESQQNDKAEVIIKTYNKYGKEVKRIESGYNTFVRLVELFNVYQFNSKALQLNKNLLPKLTLAVNSPEIFMPTYVNELLNHKEELTSNWYLERKLTISEYKKLINNKSSKEEWNNLFNRVSNDILNKANIPILPIIKRKDLLNSIICNFNNKYYDSALIIIFSVIEGLLWELSFEVNKKEQVFINPKDPKEMYDYKKKKGFQSTRIRDVIERTAVKNYLDEEFIKEFCEELYEERNPVLHGNMVCHYECKQQGICFMKKLFVLDYIMDTLEEIYSQNLFSEFDKIFDQDKINEFLKQFYDRDLN